MSLPKLNLVSLDHVIASDVMAFARYPDGVRCSCGKQRFCTVAAGERRCTTCRVRLSITQGTWLEQSKATAKQVVVAALLFCGARKGISSLELARALGMQQSAVFKLLMKFRNALYAESLCIRLQGVVEVDGAFFGGHVRHENAVRGGRKYRYSRRNANNRRVVVVLRQRLGRTLTFVGARESDAIDFIKERIDPSAVIQSDQSHAWDGLEKLYETMRINHRFTFSSNQACTNNAESYFASLRRAAIGTHHRISGNYLHLYAAEMAWRADHASLPEADKIVTLLRAVLAQRPPGWRLGPYWRPTPRAPRSPAPRVREAA